MGNSLCKDVVVERKINRTPKRRNVVMCWDTPYMLYMYIRIFPEIICPIQQNNSNIITVEHANHKELFIQFTGSTY